MSNKSSKRRQRRINTTEEEVEKKQEVIIEVSDDNKSTVVDIEKPEKDLIIIKEDKKENGDDTIENCQKIETCGDQLPIEPPQVVQTTENGVGDTISEKQIPQEDTNSDIEPLIMDSEDPELQFPSETGSETSEIDKSPVLRCKTRRSQTRNLPTPKTPKLLDFNGEADEKGDKAQNLQELRVNITRLETEVQIPEESEKSENISVISNDFSSESSLSEKTQDTDLTNASIFVNLGDTTQNMDLNVSNFENTGNASSFIETTRDKSYGETLRCLTGRKPVRNISDSYQRFYAQDAPDSSRNYPLGPSVKRKLESESPEEQKKAKTELSPGLLSYISTPFKKQSRIDIPSSTPKLTAFKYVNQIPMDDPEKIVESNKIEPKKWCSIM